MGASHKATLSFVTTPPANLSPLTVTTPVLRSPILLWQMISYMTVFKELQTYILAKNVLVLIFLPKLFQKFYIFQDYVTHRKACLYTTALKVLI